VPPPADTPLLPDPDRLRARLAELAREQQMLRKVLRAVVRGTPAPSANLSLTPSREGTAGKKEGGRGE
jgi:hypothetical protein